jgi:hypothetical protein
MKNLFMLLPNPILYLLLPTFRNQTKNPLPKQFPANPLLLLPQAPRNSSRPVRLPHPPGPLNPAQPETIGVSNPVREKAEITGASNPVREKAETTGASNPAREKAETTGASNPVREKTEITGASNPVREKTETTGASNPVREKAETTGASNPVRGITGITGVSNPAREITGIIGTSNPAREIAGITGARDVPASSLLTGPDRDLGPAAADPNLLMGAGRRLPAAIKRPVVIENRLMARVRGGDQNLQAEKWLYRRRLWWKNKPQITVRKRNPIPRIWFLNGSPIKRISATKARPTKISVIYPKAGKSNRWSCLL